MIRAGLLLSCASIAVALAQNPAPTQVFRAEVQGVSITASVRDGHRPVTGLTADDFDLRDNGVPQRISSLSLETTPVDLTVVLDTSSSVGGGILERFLRDVRAIDGMLGAGDRARLLTFASSVHEVFPMRPAGGSFSSESIAPAGATAFYHALLTAMLTTASPDRPHLIFALSDGDDNVSLLDGDDVREVARRAESVLYIVLRGSRGLWGPHIGWLAFRGPGPLDNLTEAASLTGGVLRQEKSDLQIIDVFKQALDDFKTGYVLRYVPAGVAEHGWHDVSVAIKGQHLEVRARRGYFS
jgi:VWFA-related protein